MLRYLFADSSPQIGVNWLWVSEKACQKKGVVQILEAVWSLAEAFTTLNWNDPDALSNCLSDPSLQRQSQILRDGILMYTHTPVVLGSARATQIHEASAMLHAVAMTTGAHQEEVCPKFHPNMRTPGNQTPLVVVISGWWL